MRWMILAALFFLILTVFTVPIFYDASMKGRVLRAARSTVADIMLARRLALKKGEQCGVSFDIENNSYSLSCNGGTVKTVFLKDLSKDVVFSKLFQDTGSVLDANKVVFGVDGKPVFGDVLKSSVYLINIKDEQEKDKENVIRLVVDVSGRIDMLKIDKVYPNGDLAFEPL